MYCSGLCDGFHFCIIGIDSFLYNGMQVLLTSIVLKRSVTMLDIVSTRMLGQFGFLAKVSLLYTLYCLVPFTYLFWLLQILVLCGVIWFINMQVFSIFEDLGISVDVVATSEVSISLTLDPSKLWSRELIQQARVWSYTHHFSLENMNMHLEDYRLVVVERVMELTSVLLWQELDRVVEELQNIAVVNLLQNRSIISLIGNVHYSSLILEKVCRSPCKAHFKSFSFVIPF